MAKLIHTHGAFKRYMQMTGNATVFVFVEGQDTDPYFYGEICDPVLSPANLRYEIVGAWRLADPGGKKPLLSFYEYLAATNNLLAAFQGKKMLAVFYLDKDIDDVLHSRKYSDHIVYTEHYAVENHLFVHGDLSKTASSASSLERREFDAAFDDPDKWRRACAETWKDWVTLCVFAKKYRVSCVCNYGLARSPVNRPIDAPADAVAVADHRAILQRASGMASAQFGRRFAAVARLVDGYYRRGRHDSLFKGNWYVSLVEALIHRVAAGRRYNSANLHSRILAALGPTLDFSAAWTVHFRAPLRAVIARL